jgi:hypothetical protein
MLESILVCLGNITTVASDFVINSQNRVFFLATIRVVDVCQSALEAYHQKVEVVVSFLRLLATCSERVKHSQNDWSYLCQLVYRGSCNFTRKISKITLGGGVAGIIGLIDTSSPYSAGDSGDGPIEIPA